MRSDIGQPPGVAETVGDGVVCRCRNTSVRDGRLELGSSLQRAMPGHRPPHCLHRRETGESRDPQLASFKIIGAFTVCGREGLDRVPSVLAVVIDSRNDASSDLCRRIRQAGQAGGMTFTGLPLDEVLRTERQHQARGMKGRTPADVFVRCLPTPKTTKKEKIEESRLNQPPTGSGPRPRDRAARSSTALA